MQNRGYYYFDNFVLQDLTFCFQDGFTVILVERGEGVETKSIKTSYVCYDNSVPRNITHSDSFLVPYCWNCVYHIRQCEGTCGEHFGA